MDDWSHHYHVPDNNPQLRDLLALAPYLTQFIAEPRYAPAAQSAVASAGRVFMAFGNIAWHEREEPWMNTLIATNGFNGTLLWRRPLKPGIMVDRSTMVATPATLYLAADASCKLLDSATGEVQGEITVPADLAGGTFWKWMALEDGVLYALVGEADALDTDARWRSRNHGWPWDGISKGYNTPGYEWGFARTLFAINPKTKKVLWHHREQDPIDSRALCMKGGRIYFAHHGKYLACLDAKTGDALWRRTPTRTPTSSSRSAPIEPTTVGSRDGRAPSHSSAPTRPSTSSGPRSTGSPPSPPTTDASSGSTRPRTSTPSSATTASTPSATRAARA